MIDIKLIREKPEYVQEGSRKKQVDADIEGILQLDHKRKELIFEYDNLRALQNKTSDEIVKLSGEEKKKKIEEMKEVAKRVKELQGEIKEVEEKLNTLIISIPNLPLDDVPTGVDETENVVIRKWGEPRKFNFKIKDHIELGLSLDLIDIDRAVKISGTRFYYLKNEAVLLEFALVQWVINLLREKGFTPIIPPVLAKEEIFIGMGYLPAADLEMYKTTLDNFRLAATSEQTIGAMFKDEILKEKELPLRYAGFSSCFRREAGSYGQDVKGILRVHQFDKVEMFSFCQEEDSKAEHEIILSSEEEIMQKLNIPYQVVIMCSGDLGMPAAKKYDVEAWMPGQGKYRETHSCSNCTDFQARRLNIRYRKENNDIEFVHTLNGTAVAIGRTLIAILENYQQEGGTIIIPEVLQNFLGFSKISKK